MLRLVLIFLIFFTYIYGEELKVDGDAMTKAHNKLRKMHGSPALIYSDKLERAAKKWATELQKEGCRMSHSRGRVGETGENLFWAGPRKTANAKDTQGNWIWHASLKTVTEEEVVQAWYDEVQWYDYAANRCEAGQMCGHFTQLVWNTTTEVGCAAVACDDRSQVWVCEYAPPGNVSIRHPSGRVERLKPY